MVAAAWLPAACAEVNVPAGFLPSPREAQTEAHGGWISVTSRDLPSGARAGELLALDADTLWVLTATGLEAIATASVTQATLAGYRSDAGRVGALTVLGTVSTMTNGAFLLLTAPAWILTGSIAGARETHQPIRKVPRLGWSELAPFARYPQGLPATLDRAGLESKIRLVGPGTYRTGGRRETN